MTDMQPTSTSHSFAAGYPDHVLHIEPRPFMTPCSRCGTREDLNDQAPTFANTPGQAVCVRCITDAQLDALIAVQNIDAAYSEITGPNADVDPEDLHAAREYLATVACGVFELLTYYADDDTLRMFEIVAKTQIARRLDRIEASR